MMRSESPQIDSTLFAFEDELPQHEQLAAICCSEEGSDIVKQLLVCEDVALQASLIHRIVPFIVKISMHDVGCRVIQAAIDSSIHCGLLHLVIDGLERAGPSSIRKLAMDKNGNHVLQRILAVPTKPQQCEFICYALAEERTVIELSRHRFACRVVQKLLQKDSKDYESRVWVLNAITDSSSETLFELMRDQFGNYSIQCCLEFGRSLDRQRIIHKGLLPFLMKNIACDKFASNVLEKALQFSETSDRVLLLNGLLEKEGAVNCPGYRAMHDQYGNYVIQQCLKLNPNLEGVKKIRNLVLISHRSLKQSKYGWHLVNRARQLAENSPTGKDFINKFGVLPLT